jgi:hypothetical protein
VRITNRLPRGHAWDGATPANQFCSQRPEAARRGTPGGTMSGRGAAPLRREVQRLDDSRVRDPGLVVQLLDVLGVRLLAPPGR